MARGRRPDSPETQALKGNPRKQKRQKSVPTEPQAPALPAILQPHPKLTVDAAQIWAEIAPDLERNRFLRTTDRSAFARYCATLSTYWEVAAKLQAEGRTYTSESNHGDLRRINPLFIIEDRLIKRLTDLEDRFGLTPAARQQITARMAQQQLSLPIATTATMADSLTTPEPAPISPIGLLNTAAPTQH